jgi:hypothetical protein
MNALIEIKDKDNGGALNYDLIDILKTLPDEIRNYKWVILELEARTFNNCPFNILELEGKINNSKKGLELTWEELVILARNFYQVIDTTVVGFEFDKEIRAFDPKVDLTSICDIFIKAIDSSVWEIFTKESIVLDKFNTRFKDIKILSFDN